MIIFLLWRAWHHRNNIVHGDGKASVSASVPYLVNYHRSFTRVGDEALIKEASWSPPPFGSIKVNVDAGWDSMSKMAGIGVIIRDHLGQPILAVWKPITGCASAQEAEVIACLEGLRHLIAIRRWPAFLESDCAWAVHVITDDTVVHAPEWTTILEARELLKIFSHISLSKVDRSHNGVAHVLAHLGKSGFSGCMSDSVPDCVRDLITAECMNTV
jgi:ribonuclease HI